MNEPSILDPLFVPLLLIVSIVVLEISSNLLFRRKLRRLLKGKLRGEARVDAILKFNGRLTSNGRYIIGGIGVLSYIIYSMSAPNENIGFPRWLFGGMYCVPLVIFFFSKGGNNTGQVRQKGMIKLVKEKFKTGDKLVVEDLLHALGRMGKIREKAVAVMGLEKWGSAESLDILNEIHNGLAFSNKKNEKEVADLAQKVFSELQRDLRQLDPARIATYAPLIQKRLYWKRLALASTRKNDEELRRLLDPDLLQHAPEELFMRHYAALLQPAKNFCLECQSRSTPTLFLEISLHRCRMCGEVHPLVTDVETVVGVLGPVPDSAVPGQKIVSVWDAKEEKPIYADLDELHLRAGAPINYDWAIAAVVEQQVNLRPEKFPPVALTLDPQLQISSNSQAQLNLIGREDALAL